MPVALWRSQTRLEDPTPRSAAGDCPEAIDAALDSVEAVGARAEPWELIAYCNYKLGQRDLAVGAAEAAVRRDPTTGSTTTRWRSCAARWAEDPRAEVAEARRLNPFQVQPKLAAAAFKTRRRSAVGAARPPAPPLPALNAAPESAILWVRPRAGAGFSFARRPTRLSEHAVTWPAETSGSP